MIKWIQGKLVRLALWYLRKDATKITVQLGIGDALDRWMIALIKRHNMQGEKAAIAEMECQFYSDAFASFENIHASINYAEVSSKLADVNRDLWDLEDEIRLLIAEVEALKNPGKCATQVFYQRFFEVAMSIVLKNNERSMIKKTVDEMYESTLQEVKSYV